MLVTTRSGSAAAPSGKSQGASKPAHPQRSSRRNGFTQKPYSDLGRPANDLRGPRAGTARQTRRRTGNRPSPAGRTSLHEQQLAGALDRSIGPTLIMSGQAGVLPRQDPAVIGHKLTEQVRVFEIQGVDGEIDLGLRTRSAFLHATRSATASPVPFLSVSLARHND